MATNTVSYFQSSLLAQEMENTWKGTVRFNAGQALTESEKAQARENIGAVPFGSNLKILGHFDTVAELESSAPRNVGDAYSVGATTPYNLYIYDGLSEEWKDYGQIRATDISTRYIENQSVAVAGWTADTTVFADYTYKAQITMSAATADDFPIISFEPKDAASGNFCPVAFAFDGYLEIWAKEIPAAAINIPVATIIVNGGNGRGITNATGGIAAGSIKTADLADGSVVASKIKDEGVTRDKLSINALITPILTLPASYTVTRADTGKTLRFANGNQDFVLNVVKDDQIPVGATYAIFRYAAKSNKIVFGDTAKVTFLGNSNWVVGPTFTIPEAFGQIAIMKFASDNTHDYWHVSGPAEVVT